MSASSRCRPALGFVSPDCPIECCQHRQRAWTPGRRQQPHLLFLCCSSTRQQPNRSDYINQDTCTCQLCPIVTGNRMSHFPAWQQPPNSCATNAFPGRILSNVGDSCSHHNHNHQCQHQCTTLKSFRQIINPKLRSPPPSREKRCDRITLY